MKLDPKISLGIGIGFILSSLLFLIIQPVLSIENESPESDAQLLGEDGINQNEREIDEEINNLFSNNDQEYNEHDNNGDYKSSSPFNSEDYHEGYIAIEIPKGISADQISEILERHEVLDDAGEFVDLLVNEGNITNLKPGRYEIPRGSDKKSIMKILTSGP